MRKALGFLLLACLAMSGGCSWAAMHYERGENRVNGVTDSPESAVREMSDAYVNETNTEECWKAVREGYGYACLHSGMTGGDAYSLYYWENGVVDPIPAGERGSRSAVQGNDGVTHQDLQRVEKKTDDALRRQKVLLKHLTGQEGGGK